MPLSLLLPMVVLGIAGIVLLVHLTGNSPRRRFETEEEAMAAWDREFQFAPARWARLSDDRTAALIRTEDGPGLVWTIGADSTARFLTKACEVRPANGVLHFRLYDFTAPSFAVPFRNPVKLLERLKEEIRP